MSESKIKAVIDTQLFLRAAINRRSLPARIIFDMRDTYQLCVSEAILHEVRDVLTRPEIRAKFLQLTDTVANGLLASFADAEHVVPDTVEPVSRDPKDDVFLACAKSCNAHYIVSEDKDLLVLNPYGSIQIVNALDFLHILQAANKKD